MAARRKKPKTPVAKPPTAKPWAHAYNKRLQALHTAWSEHVIDACKAALGHRVDAFDEDEPRDEKGQWTTGAGSGGKRSAKSVARGEKKKAQALARFTKRQAKGERHVGARERRAINEAHEKSPEAHALRALGGSEYEPVPGSKGEVRATPRREALRKASEKALKARLTQAAKARPTVPREERLARATSRLHEAAGELAAEEREKASEGTEYSGERRLRRIRARVAAHAHDVQRLGGGENAAGVSRKHAELQARVSEARGNFERAKSVERGLIIRPETILTSPYRERVLKRHEARLARFREKHGLRADSITEDLLAEFRPLIDALGLSKFLRRMGNSITRAQANYIKRVARVPISGVAPPDKLEAWRQENLSLIRSLNAEQIQTVGDIIRPAQAQGLRWEDVSDQIQDALGVGSNRAKLIARDQTNKWNGAMMQQTQSDAGITQYRWSTSRDLAVRGRPDGVYPKSKENHWDLEGTIHSWDEPPVIPGTNVRSHPGGRIQCRCTATPVVPWLDALA